MNELEVSQLLTVMSGFDRRQVDDISVEAWHAIPAIRAMGYQPAFEAVIAHQTGPRSTEYLSVRHVTDAVTLACRLLPGQVAADVRSARGRGLVGADWPERQQLPADVLARLFDMREVDRALAPDLIAVGGDMGDVGRRA